LDGKIWALKANSLTSPLIVSVTVTVLVFSGILHFPHRYSRSGHVSMGKPLHIAAAGIFTGRSSFLTPNLATASK